SLHRFPPQGGGRRPEARILLRLLHRRLPHRTGQHRRTDRRPPEAEVGHAAVIRRTPLALPAAELRAAAAPETGARCHWWAALLRGVDTNRGTARGERLVPGCNPATAHLASNQCAAARGQAAGDRSEER